MRFADKTTAEALAFRDYILERHPHKLAELAQVMHRDGADIDAMDCTFDSLVPLWVWMKSFADRDFPGIGGDVHKASYDFIGTVTTRFYHRVGYVGELVEHYVFEVIMRNDPGAAIGAAISKNEKRFDTYNETGLMLSDGSFVGTCERMSIMLYGYLSRPLDESMNDDHLRWLFNMYVQTRAWDGASGSLLRPLLGRTIEVVVAPTSALPAPWSEPLDSSQPWITATDQKLVFARSASSHEKIKRAKPLPVTKMTKVLAANGFESLRLKANEAQFVAEHHRILAEAIVVGRRLRALHITLDPNRVAESQRLVVELGQLAARIDARLISEDTWFGRELALVPSTADGGHEDESQAAVPADHAPIDREFVFAITGSSLDEFERAKPLPISEVATVLAANGFRNLHLNDDEAQFISDGHGILVETMVAGRKLRALHITLDDEDAAASQRLVAELGELGARIGARLASEDEWSE